MLLGKTAFSKHAEQIAKLLGDHDVTGHAINTLYKMHASSFASMVAPHLNSSFTWIKNEAKRYIEKYPDGMAYQPDANNQLRL